MSLPPRAGSCLQHPLLWVGICGREVLPLHGNQVKLSRFFFRVRTPCGHGTQVIVQAESPLSLWKSNMNHVASLLTGMFELTMLGCLVRALRCIVGL